MEMAILKILGAPLPCIPCIAFLNPGLGRGGELCEMLPSTALSRITEQHRENSLEIIRHEM